MARDIDDQLAAAALRDAADMLRSDASPIGFIEDDHYADYLDWLADKRLGNTTMPFREWREYWQAQEREVTGG